MFTYGQIEKALAAMHGVEDAVAMKTFRSRIKHFQRIEIVPSSPGKGRKVIYTIADAVYWTICFELAEFGIAPSLIKAIMSIEAYNLVTFFTGYAQQSRNFYYVIAGNFLSWHLNSDGRLLTGKHGAGILRESELKAAFEGAPRWITIDLVDVKRRLGHALQHTWRHDRQAWDPPNFSIAKPQPGDFAGPVCDFE